MGNSDTVIPSEVRDLILDSQKIGGWVARLGDHSDAARPEVVDKVRQDYETRLQAVNGQLAEHRASLTATLETRRSEVESLRVDRDEHAAELEEARLRHAVGEFSDSQWNKRKGDIQQTLDDLDELLAHEDQTVAELAEIIDSISSSGPKLVIDPPVEDVIALDQVAEVVEAEPIAETDAIDETEEVAAEVEETDDGEAGEELVAAEAETQTEVEATSEHGATTAAEEPDEESGEYLDELEFLESLSLGESDRFDAVSAMLEDEDGKDSSD